MVIFGEIDVVLCFCVENKLNMIVFGGIFIGKMVVVCKIIFLILDDECILIIEEVVEFRFE